MDMNPQAIPIEGVESMAGSGIETQLEAIHRASFGWALACCGYDRQEAEDVLQTAYLKAIEGRARFNGHSSTRTWFFAVVRLTAIEQRRYRTVRRLALLRWVQGSPTPHAAPTPEDVSGGEEKLQRLRACLARLSARQRELLHLVFYQELSIEDAAHVLGISVGSARTHYERGKAQLRKRLAEDEIR